MKLQRSKTMPEVLNIEQVHRIIDACRVERITAFFWTTYSMGLRLEEAHCPNCQKHKTQSWLAKQSERLLPVHHFQVTVTVPEELRSLLRGHRREGYTAIFD